MKPVEIKSENGRNICCNDGIEITKPYEDYRSTASSTVGRSITYNFDKSEVTPKGVDVIGILKQCLNARYGRQAFVEKIAVTTNKANMHGQIKKVVFNNPATIVIWADGTKTVVKCDGERFDPEKGLAMAITKKLLGNNEGYYYEVFKKWLPKKESKVGETEFPDLVKEFTFTGRKVQVNK